jgi:hypothetical protein
VPVQSKCWASMSSSKRCDHENGLATKAVGNDRLQSETKFQNAAIEQVADLIQGAMTFASCRQERC